MPRWIFVRHGESVANKEGWLAGHRDAPLTDHGRQQALAIRPDIHPVHPVRAFTSDLSRARHTAELILDGTPTPLTMTPALRERSLGAWEGQDKATLRDSGELEIALTLHGHPPLGESLHDVARRALAFLHSIDDGTGPTLIVAHGGLLRVVIGLLDGLQRDQIGTWAIPNTAILVRDTEIGTWETLT
jgi:broad specificity phosphatase PhoE